MIKHHQRPESPNNIRMALVRMAWYCMNKDGLSTAKYRLVSKQVLPLYTHLLVDIGQNLKWHFSSSQKLIINLWPLEPSAARSCRKQPVLAAHLYARAIVSTGRRCARSLRQKPR
ncbi:hypothetical protein HPB51_027483 [Rhipicephalus microplus]|uniref:Uncharacterized protein n=1 Tax=Rhipicephalus microplus TaxID=6941 RepID=A0A9J6D048_RHIMP|nr:hypothetical protein HPB51_027483 [Rhipicephalus microplus]